MLEDANTLIEDEEQLDKEIFPNDRIILCLCVVLYFVVQSEIVGGQVNTRSIQLSGSFLSTARLSAVMIWSWNVSGSRLVFAEKCRA